MGTVTGVPHSIQSYIAAVCIHILCQSPQSARGWMPSLAVMVCSCMHDKNLTFKFALRFKMRVYIFTNAGYKYIYCVLSLKRVTSIAGDLLRS